MLLVDSALKSPSGLYNLSDLSSVWVHVKIEPKSVKNWAHHIKNEWKRNHKQKFSLWNMPSELNTNTGKFEEQAIHSKLAHIA